MTGTTDLRGIKLALATYVVVFVMKLAVYFMSGVMALLAEAFHTLSDVLISGFLLLAARWSRKAPDQVHMFGYGRAQNVAALVAATLFISFTSLRLYEEAIPRLFRPEAAAYENLPLAVGVLVVSMLIAAAPLVVLLRQRARGAAARAQLMELVNDELGLVAALVGTLFVIRGQPLADPIATLVVATIIAANAVGLFKDNLRVLIGRSPGPEYLAKVERAARSVDGVEGVRDLKAEYVGPDEVHAGMRIGVRRGVPVEEAGRIVAEVRRRVQDEVDCRHCFVELDVA
ncbi:MAG TPA: cation diffusion facilitator family transporter [Thermodesulfobacteriota bacterium]